MIRKYYKNDGRIFGMLKMQKGADGLKAKIVDIISNEQLTLHHPIIYQYIHIHANICERIIFCTKINLQQSSFDVYLMFYNKKALKNQFLNLLFRSLICNENKFDSRINFKNFNITWIWRKRAELKRMKRSKTEIDFFFF